MKGQEFPAIQYVHMCTHVHVYFILALLYIMVVFAFNAALWCFLEMVVFLSYRNMGQIFTTDKLDHTYVQLQHLHYWILHICKQTHKTYLHNSYSRKYAARLNIRLNFIIAIYLYVWLPYTFSYVSFYWLIFHMSFC